MFLEQSYSGVFTKLHISRLISPHSAIFQQIQNPGINGSNNVRLYLLCKSGSSFLNHRSNLLGTFFHFCFKIKHSTFVSSGQYLNNNNNNKSMPPTSAHHPHHPRYTHQNFTHISTPPTVALIVCHYSNSSGAYQRDYCINCNFYQPLDTDVTLVSHKCNRLCFHYQITSPVVFRCNRAREGEDL